MVVVVVAPEDAGAALLPRLATSGARSIEVVTPGTRPLLLVALDDATEAERLAAALRSEGVVAVARPSEGPRLEAWQRHTEPITVGGRLAVRFAWSEHPRPAVEHLVELGPGGWAGHHPTTRLLLEELAARVAGGERVLDVGCGSGVLGLGALALGAARLVAVDLQPSAVEATLCNAALNGAADRVSATAAPIEEVVGPFDVVVANVGRGALVELGAELARLVAPGGWLGASGFAPSQLADVAAALRPLTVLAHRSEGEWSAVVLRSPVDRPPTVPP